MADTPRVTVPVEDLLFYKLKDLILEQSEGEWTDEMIVRDAHHFANHIRPLLSAAPAPEGGAVEATERLAWLSEINGSCPGWVVVNQNDLRIVLSALRAQPLAREDAQPDAGARLAKAMWGVDLVPATHHAPDALRAAVAAYLTAVDDLETPVMSPSLGLHRKEVARQARGKLREALAALQAEQKGGA